MDTFTDLKRADAAGLLDVMAIGTDEAAERLTRIAAVRADGTDVLKLYDRPLDLAAAARELGVADAEEVRRAVLRLPSGSAGDKLGLGPLLTPGGTVPRRVWAFADVPRTTYGELCMRLKLGRRLVIPFDRPAGG